MQKWVRLIAACDLTAASIIYTYVGGNPISYRDPNGKELVGALIGTVAGVSAGYVAGGYTGAFFGGVAGAAVGLVNPGWSYAAGEAVAQMTGSVWAGMAASGAVFEAQGVGAAMAATAATNAANRNSISDDMGWAATIGALAPLISGEAAIVAAGEGAIGTMTGNIISGATGVAGIVGAAIDPNSTNGISNNNGSACH